MRAVDDWVIDCDTHITEPGDVWTARLPSRFQADAPRLVRDLRLRLLDLRLERAHRARRSGGSHV